MSKNKLPTVESLLERYKIACDLKQPVNREKITECMRRWWNGISRVPMTIRFAETGGEWIYACRLSWQTWEAWEAWQARLAWQDRLSWQTWEAWEAWEAWQARLAWQARQAWQDRQARQDRLSWQTWEAWQAAWISTTAIGAVELGDAKTYKACIPIFEAFEFGAFCFCITGSEIVVCDLPKKVLKDGNNLLHCDDGPAFEWLADVFEYYIHGINVPEKVVLAPETITLDDIDSEENAEVRRIMMERYGLDRYFLDSGAKLLDFDFVRVAINDERTMPRMLVQTKHEDKWLVGTDGSTTRVYHMPVFSWVKTCREAHYSICGLWDEQIIAQG